MWDERLNKLTEADRERVIQLRDEGISNAAIAKRFNVSDATVSRILDEVRKAVKADRWGQREKYGDR